MASVLRCLWSLLRSCGRLSSHLESVNPGILQKVMNSISILIRFLSVLSMAFHIHAVASPVNVVDLVDFLKNHSENEDLAVPIVGIIGCIGKIDCREYSCVSFQFSFILFLLY